MGVNGTSRRDQIHQHPGSRPARSIRLFGAMIAELQSSRCISGTFASESKETDTVVKQAHKALAQ